MCSKGLSWRRKLRVSISLGLEQQCVRENIIRGGEGAQVRRSLDLDRGGPHTSTHLSPIIRMRTDGKMPSRFFRALCKHIVKAVGCAYSPLCIRIERCLGMRGVAGAAWPNAATRATFSFQRMSGMTPCITKKNSLASQTTRQRNATAASDVAVCQAHPLFFHPPCPYTGTATNQRASTRGGRL